MFVDKTASTDDDCNNATLAVHGVSITQLSVAPDATAANMSITFQV